MSRGAFLLYEAAACFVFVALMIALYVYESSAGNYENGGPVAPPSTPAAIAAATLWLLALAALAVSEVLACLRRLHDRGKAWPWLLVFVVAPSALHSFGQYWSDTHVATGAPLGLALRGLSFSLSLWAFVDLACLKGVAGPNRFGPDPRASSS